MKFISSTDNGEEFVMYSKSGNIEIMIYDKADKLSKNFLNHFFLGIKLGWKNKRKVVIDYVDLLCYKCYKINLSRSKSYIDSPNCIENKKELINPVNDYDKRFQYAATVALNHEEIGKNCKEYKKLSLL